MTNDTNPEPPTMTNGLRLTSWIDEDGLRYFDLRDYTPDGTGWRQHFGDIVAGRELGGMGWPEARMRDHLRAVLGWSPAVIDAAIAAAIEQSKEPPPEITVLPAERFGGEWRFRLAASWRADRSGGVFEGGLPEAEFREALAAQGYDAAAISLAVVEAIEAGKFAPPDVDDDVPF